jgi:hypothetical protein
MGNYLLHSVLPLDWAERNVVVLYPTKGKFLVEALDGIVLWKEGPSDQRYKLYEGNHRFSTWLTNQTPPSLPAVIFIGQSKT